MKSTRNDTSNFTLQTFLKPYPAMKNSGVEWLGDVPEHWEVRRAKCLYREVDERSVSGSEELMSVSHKTGVTPRKKNVTMFLAENNVGHKVCRPGDLAINTMWAYMAALGIARKTGLVSPSYGVYRPIDPEILAPDFIDRLLRTEGYKSEYLCRSTGITSSRLRLYPDAFLRIPILCPPVPDQVTIVRYLEYVDRRVRRLVRAKQKLIGLLEEQKQAIIHRAVTRGLPSTGSGRATPDVPLKDSGVEWLGKVPEHWEVVKIRHFARVGNGSTPSRSRTDYWTSGRHAWLNSSVANRERVNEAEQFVTDVALKECHLPRLAPGDVLIAITGQGKTRGKSTVLAIDATINQHLSYVHLRIDRMLPEYLQLVFSGAYAHLRSISDDSGSTKGALTCADIRHFKVPLPPPVEQREILDWVRQENEASALTIEVTHRQIDLLREYRTRLIADVVTGKLDVGEAAANLREESADLEPLEEETTGELDTTSGELDA